MYRTAFFVLLLAYTPSALQGQDGSQTAPGVEQQRLEMFAGSYIATVRTWATPDAEPSVSTMLSDQQMIMGGRFLQVEDRTEDGSFHWRAVHGFDPARGHYRSIGISNASNLFSIADSFISEDGDWLVLGVNSEGVPFKGIGRITADGYTYTNFRVSPGGEEVRYREIVYQRH